MSELARAQGELQVTKNKFVGLALKDRHKAANSMYILCTDYIFGYFYSDDSFHHLLYIYINVYIYINNAFNCVIYKYGMNEK